MCNLTKVQQKYKGTRRIERRPLIPQKKLCTNYPKNYVHHVKQRKINSWWTIANGELVKYRLIYQ